MIKQEDYKENLIKTYSDNNVYIKQVETGREYVSAVDVKPLRYTYVETNRKIEPIEEKIEKSSYELFIESLKKE